MFFEEIKYLVNVALRKGRRSQHAEEQGASVILNIRYKVYGDKTGNVKTGTEMRTIVVKI